MGDQGKSRDDAGALLSQIALHDMYAAAIEAGAPLAVHSDTFNQLSADYQQWYSFRNMDASNREEFNVSPKLVSTFNHWLSTTLIDTQQESDLSDSPIYSPFRFETVCLEQIMEDQLSWITGWRIMRFASPLSSPMNIASQPFFQQASQHPKIQAQPYESGYGKQAYNALAEEWSLLACNAQLTEKKRNDEIAKHRNNEDWFPGGDLIGSPLFDATNARGQLWEAALEFAADYVRRPRPEPLLTLQYKMTKHPINEKTCTIEENTDSSFAGSVPLTAGILQILDPLLLTNAYVYTRQNEAVEYFIFKDNGNDKYERSFLPYFTGKKDPKIGSLIDLYDNYIHDSQAWFMHSESGVREPFGGYFLSRMIYFGDKWNKAVLLRFDGNYLMGVDKNLQKHAVFAHHPTYGVKIYHRQTGQEIIVNENELPASTHEFIAQLKPLVQQRKDDRQAQIYANLQKIANGTFVS
ncbi:T6SS phospholipase effector Tle1-like catalytic domain-containing protein [Providencia sp. PROV149]|uniref:T6SS phospholipase effector Tle1-like catalytic domain-containing protein n=1 Tax=Providencia sp. PROV149 TaxID=2949859 RepID=UPI002349B8E2|nr:hypothetical protein [Providencia sp. PROV149]